MKYLITLIISALTFPTVSFATTINVPGDYSTIQEGINIAIDGDTVLVDSGIYVENINFSGKKILVASNYLITGEEVFLTETVIDGNDNGSVITFNSGEDSSSIIYGFTITNGNGEEPPYLSGGGITCWNTSPTLANLNIKQNNSRGYGGGILCWYSNPFIKEVMIYLNDTVYDGGGIYCHFSNPILMDVTIDRNFNSGLYCSNSSPVLRDVLLIFNQARDGGGIACDDNSNPILRNVLIYGNIANYRGGGLSISNSSPQLINVTIGNNSTGEGGAMYCDYSSPILLNCILWNNGTEQIFDFSSEINIFYSDIEGGWSGEGNIDIDPLFVDQANFDFRLQFGSPCIDVGIAFFTFNGDTINNLSADEYIGSSPDLGAIEFNPTSINDNENIGITAYCLFKNYPNPFNSITLISYKIPKPEFVNLSIYNIAGQLVQILVNEERNGGLNSVQWNAENVGTGLYFFRIIAGDYVETKKCMILK